MNLQVIFGILALVLVAVGLVGAYKVVDIWRIERQISKDIKKQLER